jgi:glutathione synthase/RimK-type ligase-like ATP-grasp enzyme
LPRTSLAEAKSLGFPLLLRSPGFHAGMNFLRVEAADELMAAAQRLPGEDLFAIEYLDARGADGMARKYRVMTIGGKLYPTHLAISQDWKVHYFTANMSESAAHRAEEKEFLENMPRVLGPKAMVALASIAKELGLDYAGIDFALNKDGSIALFEANATMVINPVGPESLWDYRREAIDNALAATRNLVQGAAAGP